MPQDDIKLARQAFQEKGFYLKKGFFPKATIVQAREWLKSQDQEALAKTWTDQEPGVPLAVLQGIQYQENPLGVLANNQPMIDFASELLNEKVYVWSSKINVKASWCGTAEYYHQDFIYWSGRGYNTDAMMSAMVIMEPHKLRNAALHVFPGSHRAGQLRHEPFINVNGLSKFMIPPRLLDELFKEYGLHAVEGDEGDVLFFHTGLVHGSAHNISEQPRMILLSQLNSVNNKPVDVKSSAKNFNLERCGRELAEAERRHQWFKDKFERQKNAEGVTFNSPIPKDEAY